MLKPMRWLAHWLRARRNRAAVCLYCGYRGRAARRAKQDHIYFCPVCAGDWYSRPPRSYREMEGLDGSTAAQAPTEAAEPTPRTAIIGGLLELLRLR